jgi:hypothetical protein
VLIEDAIGANLRITSSGNCQVSRSKEVRMQAPLEAAGDSHLDQLILR